MPQTASHDTVSHHYLGSAGEAYARARQTDVPDMAAELNAAYFRPFLKPTDALLDFGCGTGAMLRKLQHDVRLAEGLEVNPTSAARAREAGFTVHGSLESLGDAGPYDAIVSNHVLEHVRDVCSTLEILRQRLRPGGLFIAKLPIDDAHAAHHRRWSADDVDHHLHTWTPRLFANVLFESGYDVRDAHVVTSAWHPRLFFLARLGLAKPAFWALAVLKKRRQLFAVGARRPD